MTAVPYEGQPIPRIVPERDARPVVGAQAFSIIRLSGLRKSPGNKREFQLYRAEVMAHDFQMYSAGALHVAYRDGVYWVVDGWHRVQAALIAGVRMLPAMIRGTASEAEESEWFAKLNTERVRPDAISLFWANADAGEESALAVLRACEATNVVLAESISSGSRAPNVTRAHRALQKLAHAHGEALLVRGLRICRRVWPEDQRALHAQVVVPITGFVALYDIHKDYSDEVFVQRLGRLSVKTLLQNISSETPSTGAQGGQGGAYGQPGPRRALLAAYNHKARSKRLPETNAKDINKRGRGLDPWQEG